MCVRMYYDDNKQKTERERVISVLTRDIPKLNIVTVITIRR